jgi:hypothetical protein
VETLPVYVDVEAYLSQPLWLSTGYLLWNVHRNDRDYFLMLPDPSKEGVIAEEVMYPDARALTRSVLGRVPGEGAAPLLDAEAAD